MRHFAQIAVENTVYHFDKLFTYGIPEEMTVLLQPGMRVMVPFGSGNKTRVGMVFSLDGEETANLKSIVSILDKEPVLACDSLELALWMKERYYCTIFEAVKLMIPIGLQLRLEDSYLLDSEFKNFDREAYDSLSWQIITSFKAVGRAMPFKKLSALLGIEEDCPEFQMLIEKGIIRKVNLAMNKVKDATAKMIHAVPNYSGKLTPRQKEVFRVLSDVGEVSEKELCYFTGVSGSVIKKMIENGAVEAFEYETYRRPEVLGSSHFSQEKLVLSTQQQQVLNELIEEYKSAGTKSNCALLFGITGSGKTLVFLKLIEYVLHQGKGIIVMVPEISLTPQALQHFQQIFGDLVAVFHSGLSLGERMDEWKRVRRGEARIAVGTRSAVFAPVESLGLIVIDEEQEHTYKSESSPRYDAREVARYRCSKSGAFCLLSSATPSLESYYMAKEGRYAFNRLQGRFGTAKIPTVHLADMNNEFFPGSDWVVGSQLAEALTENYAAGKQSIILLNRRGYHTFVSCQTCREVVTCPNCSISMTYHRANNRLMCHYCGYSIPTIKKCPSCGNETLTFRGLGTQKAEEQLRELLPEARILRMDTDSISTRYSLEKYLAYFAQGEYDVMIGTQMVAKGLNFENVTLVGVLSADQALYSDDFRSNERTFDLLTQVVGRAGRGKYLGKAIIQTCVPENPVLHLAARQDYFSFADQELAFRKALLYPPFVDFVVIGFIGSQDEITRCAAERFLTELSTLAKREYAGIPLRVLRPSPAAIVKMNGKYRYKLIIKCKNSPLLRKMVRTLLINFAGIHDFRHVTVYADPNPNRIT